MITLPALLSIAALAQPLPETPLDARARQVAALVAAEPAWPDDLFDASFTKAVPAPKLKDLCSGIFEQFGKIEALNLVHKDTDLSGKFEAILEKGFVMPVTIGLLPAPPHSIVTLWFGPPAPGLKDLNAAAEEMAKLPGSVSFGVYRLGDKEPALVVEKNAESALALGSAFKLYVLGALVRDLADGKHHLEDVVKLEERWCSMPSGKLQRWPKGSPVTLATLASLMISESDNTATDHLLFTLGREKVEAMLPVMGNSSAARNQPFLSTGEMFRMKYFDGGKLAEEYLKLDVPARREFLAKEVAAQPLDPKQMDPGALVHPSHIDTVEWFASAHDLARAMDWLRRATESPETKAVREILGINPGLDISKEDFPFIGFKGGSEVGVLNLTYLLRAQNGDWYAASAGWNDPDAAVDEQKPIGLMTRALCLLGKEAEKPTAK
jgi:hypothetical protein